MSTPRTASTTDARKRLAENAAAPEPTGLPGYFVAPDAYDVPTIWRGDLDDLAPKAVLNRLDLRECPDLWDALAAAIEARP